MAVLWVKDPSDRWMPHPLEGEAFFLSTAPPRLLDWEAELEMLRRHVLLIRDAAVERESWILLAGAETEARVNGLPLPVGIRVLDDRDEIRVEGAATLFLSMEGLPEVRPFPGEREPICCPRCKLEIDRGAAAVRCTACNVWYHQSEEFPCWTYTEACALCPQPTDLGAGYRWTPEDL